MLAGIAQQQRSGVNELGGRRLSAVRECFQPAAFFFGEGNLISGCHASIIHQWKHTVNIRTITCYLVLGIDSGVQSHPKATPRLHQGSTKATSEPYQSHPKAT